MKVIFFLILTLQLTATKITVMMKINLLSISLLLSFLSSSLSSLGASRYWVATTSGNWNSTSNWSATSGGSSGASVPTSADDVIFNGVGGRNGNCTIDATVNVVSLNISGYSGTITNTSYSITINSGYLTVQSGTLNCGSGDVTLASQMWLTGGTFNGGSGSFSVGNYLNISSGTFTASSGTMNISSNWEHTGGTFNHNNGTVVFNGTGNRQLKMVGNLETFYNLTINKSSGYVGLVNTNDNALVLNDLTLTSSSLNSWNSNQVSVEVRGDVVVSSSFGVVGNYVTLIFSGTANQDFDLTNATNKLDHAVKVNKSSGTLTMLSDCLLDGTSGFTFTSGTLNLNGKTLTNSSYQSYCDGTFTLSGTGTLNSYGWSQTSPSANFTISGASTFIIGLGHFTMSNGTFTAGSSTLDFNGHVQLSGGTFNGTSDTLNLSKNWQHTTAGTYNHNNGTINLDGTFTSPPGSIRMVGNTETFYNLIMNVSGSQVLYSAGDNLIIAGNLTLNTGSLATWNGGDQVSTEVKGDVTIASGFGTSSADVTVKFTGTTATQNLSLGSPAKILGNIVENKASGEVKLLSNITVASGKSFTVTSGTLSTNGYNMTLNGTSVIQTGATLKIQGIETIGTPTLNSGSSVIYTGRNISETITIKDHGATDYYNLTIDDQNTNKATYQLGNNLTVTNLLTMTSGVLNAGSYVLSLGSVTGTYGEVNNTLPTLNAPNNQNLGTLGYVLTTTANLGSTTIKLGFTPRSSGGNSGIHRYYHLVPTNNTNLNATVKFQYMETELNGITEADLVLFESSNGTSWTVMSSALDATNNHLTVSGLASLNYLTAGSSSAPLPISLLYFNAERTNQNVHLSWSTAAEVNNELFTIERSADGIEFRPVLFLAGAGNSNKILKYDLIDHDAPAGTLYYRLKQTDFDGLATWSDIIVLKQDVDQNAVINPSFNQGTMEVKLPKKFLGLCKIQIYNASGVVCQSNDIVIKSEHENFQIARNTLPSGVYFIHLSYGGKNEIIKVAWQH